MKMLAGGGGEAEKFVCVLGGFGARSGSQGQALLLRFCTF